MKKTVSPLQVIVVILTCLLTLIENHPRVVSFCSKNKQTQKYHILNKIILNVSVEKVSYYQIDNKPGDLNRKLCFHTLY